MASQLKRRSGKSKEKEVPRILEMVEARLGLVREQFRLGEDTAGLAREIAGELEGDPAFARCFLEEIAAGREPWTGLLLAQLSPLVFSKPVRRQLKGIRYRWRQQGLELPAGEGPREGREGILRRSETQAPEGYLSDFDELGNRLIALVVPRFPQGRILIFGLINWDRGLEDLSAMEVSKKQVKAIIEETEAKIGQRLHPDAPGPVIYLLREARALAPTLKPEDEKIYAYLSNYLGTLTDIPAEPGIRSLTRGADPVQDGGLGWEALTKVPELARFHLPPEELSAYVLALKKIEESPLVLSPGQQGDRMREVIVRAAAELFSESRVGRLVRLVEEMAYLHGLKGQEEQVRDLTAGLDAFRKEVEARPRSIHPFLTWLLEKEFRLSGEAPEPEPPPLEERTEGGLIVPSWVKK